MKDTRAKAISDRWSRKGFIPTSHTAGSSTSCISYQRRTDEIMDRRIGLPGRNKKRMPGTWSSYDRQGDRWLYIFVGIIISVFLWCSYKMAWELWTIMGGH